MSDVSVSDPLVVVGDVWRRVEDGALFMVTSVHEISGGKIGRQKRVRFVGDCKDDVAYELFEFNVRSGRFARQSRMPSEPARTEAATPERESVSEEIRDIAVVMPDGEVVRGEVGPDLWEWRLKKQGDFLKIAQAIHSRAARLFCVYDSVHRRVEFKIVVSCQAWDATDAPEAETTTGGER